MNKKVFRIEKTKSPKGVFGFGLGITHVYSETYLYICVLKWLVLIGFFDKTLRRDVNL